MNSAILLASTVCLFVLPLQSNGPVETGPLRNTFAVAVETVIDNAAAIDIKAANATFDAQMRTLKTSRDNLNTMASDSREKDIASDANNMVFLISACHVQANNGADTAQCQAQSSKARSRMMESIGKHKSGNSWVDGPPV